MIGRLGQMHSERRQVSDAVASPEPSFVVGNVALLLYTPQFANEVVATTCAVIDAPAARSADRTASTWHPSAPVRVQAGVAPLCEAIVQSPCQPSHQAG